MNENVLSLSEKVPAGPVGSERWLPAWDGALYAANTGHHRAHDERFLASVPLRPNHQVLDLGCGAGDLTAIVARLVPSGHVIGLDPQPSLLAEARRIAQPNQSFVEGAAQDLAWLLPDGDQFDVVLSQSVLHWIPQRDHAGILGEVRRLLRPGGWFRAEFGGIGNIPAVLRLLDEVSSALGGPACPWFFTDAGHYLELVEGGGFDVGDGFVRTTAQRRGFTRHALLGWFRSQCVQAYEAGLPSAEAAIAFRQQVEARFDELARGDGSYDQTFVRMEVLARRPADPSASEGLEQGSATGRQPVPDLQALGEPELLELAYVDLERGHFPVDHDRQVAGPLAGVLGDEPQRGPGPGTMRGRAVEPVQPLSEGDEVAGP